MYAMTPSLPSLLSPPGPALYEPGGLLVFLAAVGAEQDPALRAEASALVDAQLDAESLEAVATLLVASLELRLAAEPDGETAEEIAGWLDELALLTWALRGVSAMPPSLPWPRAALEERLTACEPGLRALAAQGWRIPPALAGELTELSEPGLPQPLELAFEAWRQDLLAEPTTQALLRALAQDADTLARYRRWLADAADVVDVVRYEPGWTLACTEDLHDPAPPIWSLALPHAGPGALLEIHLHRDGTRWTLPGAEPWIVPAGSPEHRWGDQTTGPILTAIREHRPSARSDRWQALLSARAVADDPSSPRAANVAMAISQDLERGELARQLELAAEAFDDDVEDEALEDWAAFALEARLQLQRVAERLDTDSLYEALERVDRALEPFADGTLLVDPELIEQLYAIVAPDPGAWWGAPAALDLDLPAHIAEAALSDAAAWHVATEPAPATQPEPGLIEQLRWTFQNLMAGFRAPVFPGAQTALAGSDDWDEDTLPPGCAPLLVYLPERDTGAVVGLRVRYHEQGEPSSDAPEPLRFGARQALRQAYEAAAAQMPGGWPGRPFEVHRIELVSPDGERFEIDQDSLTLPAILAFASLWTRVPLPANLAATGTVQRDRRVGAVAWVPEKALALAAVCEAAGFSPRLLLEPSSALELELPGVTAVPVADVAQALGYAGLLPVGDGYRPEIETVRDGERRLQQLIGDVRDQQLEPYSHVAGIPPWTMLADQLAWLVQALEARGCRNPPLLVDGRCAAAEAYSHAGEIPRAMRVLGDTEPPSQASQQARFAWHVRTLAGKLDSRDWDAVGTQVSVVQDELRKLTPDVHAQQAGAAMGTMGRALLHGGRAADALPLLQAGVDHHVLHQPAETGRSRIYLAMAMRRLGRLDDARAELEQARADIDADTREHGRSYHASTLMYWRYERARLALEAGDPAEAIALTEPVLAQARACWPWPLVPILRTRAWAFAQLARDGDHADAMAELDQTIERAARIRAPGAMRTLHIIQAEAHGPFRRDGEVY